MTVLAAEDAAAMVSGRRSAHGAASARGRRASRRPAAADPRVTAPGSTAAQQRQAIEDVKASRRPENPPSPAPVTPSPASPGGGFSVPAVPAAVSTGSGFALGVLAWAVGLAYLKHGWPGVRQFGASKFFNKAGGLTR